MIEVGSIAPDFKLVSQFNTEFTLSEFRSKKKTKGINKDRI